MLCQSCNKESQGSVCKHCGFDLVLLKKTTAISDYLYNRGLALAKKNDVSGAVDVLIRSVRFNKKNSNARNLLGLCYYRLGRIGEALREWVISFSYKKDNNLADYYLAYFQKNPREMEDFSDTVGMYNQALLYLQQKSEDIAAIQLKKALEKNPNSVDALNLLALCSISQKDRSKAGTLVEKVLRIDSQNPIALNYLKELNLGNISGEPKPRAGANTGVANTKPSAPYSEPKQKSQFSPYINAKKPRSGFPFSEILCFLVGVACTFGVMYYMFLPSELSLKDAEITKARGEVTAEKTKYETAIKDKEKEKAALNERIAELEKTKGDVELKVKDMERIQKVNNASSVLQQNRPEEAIAMLAGTDTEGLPVDVLETYNHVKKTAYPLVEKVNYEKGIADYNARRYDEAKAALEKSVAFAPADSTTIDDSLYFMGRIAEIKLDIPLAKSYYENILNNHKGSNRESYAKTRMSRFR